MKGVSSAVCRAARTGALGSVTPGDMFLLRQEDRVLWVQVKSSNTIISLPFLCFLPPLYLVCCCLSLARCWRPAMATR